MEKVFKYESYKKFLRDWIEDGQSGMGDLAKAAQCHRTYLSQVLNGKADLTSDHAVNLCEYFGFDSYESTYFLTCHLYERSRLKSAREALKKKLTSMQQKFQQVGRRINGKERVQIETGITLPIGAYYSDSNIALVHMATSCLETQTVQKISENFNIYTERVSEILELLIQLDLVIKRGDKYIHSGKNIHLDDGNLFSRTNHLNWRIRAAQSMTRPTSLHYTNVFSVSKTDVPVIREKLLQFLETQSKQISRSGSEEVLVFCCDLFLPKP